MSVFDKPQRDALAMLFIHLHNHGFGIAQFFWGLWLFPLALLVYRSRLLPRFPGVWLAFGGIANVMLSLTGILSPQYHARVFTWSQPALFGEVAVQPLAHHQRRQTARAGRLTTVVVGCLARTGGSALVCKIACGCPTLDF